MQLCNHTFPFSCTVWPPIVHPQPPPPLPPLSPLHCPLQRAGLVEVLIEYLSYPDLNLRQWSAHCLFFFMHNNEAVSKRAAEYASTLEVRFDGCVCVCVCV